MVSISLLMCILATWMQELVSPAGSVRSIWVRADVQAWKHPHDQSAGLYGASKWPV